MVTMVTTQLHLSLPDCYVNEWQTECKISLKHSHVQSDLKNY